VNNSNQLLSQKQRGKNNTKIPLFFNFQLILIKKTKIEGKKKYPIRHLVELGDWSARKRVP
jgi:hypothetical protein